MLCKQVTDLNYRVSWAAVLGAYTSPSKNKLKQGSEVAQLEIVLVVCFAAATFLECIRISVSGTVEADLGNLPRIMKEWSRLSNAPVPRDAV